MRYFRHSEHDPRPWHGPLATNRHYVWDVDPSTGVPHVAEVDSMTDLLLEAVEAALDAYCAAHPRDSMRAGVFLEILANALLGRGGLDLTLRFRPAIDGGEVSVPARP